MFLGMFTTSIELRLLGGVVMGRRSFQKMMMGAMMGLSRLAGWRGVRVKE